MGDFLTHNSSGKKKYGEWLSPDRPFLTQRLGSARPPVQGCSGAWSPATCRSVTSRFPPAQCSSQVRENLEIQHNNPDRTLRRKQYYFRSGRRQEGAAAAAVAACTRSHIGRSLWGIPHENFSSRARSRGFAPMPPNPVGVKSHRLSAVESLGDRAPTEGRSMGGGGGGGSRGGNDSAGPSSTWTKTTGYGSVAVNDGVEADASLWSRVRDDFEVLRKVGSLLSL